MSGPGSKKGPFSRRNQLSPVQYAGRSFNSSLRYSPTQWLLLIPCVGALFPPFSSYFFFFLPYSVSGLREACVSLHTHTDKHTHNHTHTHMETQSIPLAPSFSPAVPVCSNLCRQLYKFTHTALELNCDVMM